MKKLSFLLLAMICSIMAQAWTVNFTNPNGWTNVNCYTFNPETNGTWPGKAMTKSGDVWTYTGTGTPANIIFNNGSSSQTNNLALVDGATYDMNGPVGAEKHEYKMGFSNNENWAEVYVYTFGPELFGTWPGTKLEKAADGYYYATYEATSSQDVDGIIFNNGSGSQTDDLKWQEGKVVNVDGTLVGEGPNPPTPGDDYSKWYVNVLGDFNEWMDNGIQPNAAGVCEHKNLAIGTSGFKIKIWNGTADVYYTYDQPIVPGEPVVINEDLYNGDPMTISGATEDQAYNVTFDCATNTLTVTKVGDDPNPPTPGDDYTTWYFNVVGNFNEWKDNGVNFDADGNAAIAGLDINADGFKIKVWNGSEDLWFTNGETIALNTDIHLDRDIYNQPEMKVPDANLGHAFTVYFNIKTQEMKVVDDTLSAVEGIEVADEAPVYFNLQGVKVANPEKGIYVKVAGGKAAKVVL